MDRQRRGACSNVKVAGNASDLNPPTSSSQHQRRLRYDRLTGRNKLGTVR